MLAIFGWGMTFYSFGLYHASIQASHDIPAGLIGLAAAAQSISAAFFSIATGYMIARRGPQASMLLGGLSIAGVGFAVGWITQLDQASAKALMVLPFVLGGIGFAALTSQSISAVMMARFDDRMGTPLSLALSGASFGGIVVPLMIVKLQAFVGIANAMYIMGAFAALATLLLVPRLSSTRVTFPKTVSASVKKETGARSKEILWNTEFWKVAVPICLSNAVQIAFFMHLAPRLEENVGLSAAAVAVSLAAGAAFIGRLIVGYFTNFLSPRLLAIICYLIQGGGIIGFAFAEQLTHAYVSAVVTGSVIGAIVLLTPLLLRGVLTGEEHAKGFGFVTGGYHLLAFFTAAAAGLGRELTEGYMVPFIMLGLVAIAAALGLACHTENKDQPKIAID